MIEIDTMHSVRYSTLNIRLCRTGNARAAYCALQSRLCRMGKGNTFALCLSTGSATSPPVRMVQVSVLCKVGQCSTVHSKLCRTGKNMACSHGFACPTGSAMSRSVRMGLVTLLNTVVDTVFSRLCNAG